jgi:hypothetical protein
LVSAIEMDGFHEVTYIIDIVKAIIRLVSLLFDSFGNDKDGNKENQY